MKPLIIVVVLAAAGFGAYKLFAKKETEAFKAYCTFADALFKNQPNICRQLSEGAEAEQQIVMADVRAKRAIMQLNYLGSEYEFESETAAAGGKEVTVKLIQNMNYSVGSGATVSGLWKKSRHTAKMVRVGDQWKVASYSQEDLEGAKEKR